MTVSIAGKSAGSGKGVSGGGSSWEYYEKAREEAKAQALREMKGQQQREQDGAEPEPGAARDSLAYYEADKEREPFWIEGSEGVAGVYGLTAGAAVERADLERVIDQAPDTFKVSKAKNDYQDICFSADKPISVAWSELGAKERDVVQACHEAGVRAGFSVISDHAAYVRRGSTPQTQRREKAVGLVGAVYTQGTSRALDPQLHSHVLTPTAVKSAEDQVFSRLEMTAAYAEARSGADAVYHAVTRNSLHQELGWEFGPVNERTGAAPVIGIDEAEVKFASKRSVDIEQLAAVWQASREAELGRPLNKTEVQKLREDANKASRAGKDLEATPAVFRAWRKDRAKRTETTSEERAQAFKAATERAKAARLAMGPVKLWTGAEVLEEALRSTGNASVSETQLRRVAARTIDVTVPPSEIPAKVAALAAEALEIGISLTPGHEAANECRYTSERIFNVELKALATLEANRGRNVGSATQQARKLAFDPDAQGRKLSGEQLAGVMHLTRPGLHRALVAPGGTGKTVTIARAVQVWQHDEQKVLVLSHAANAAAITANEIKDVTGVRPDETTISSFLGTRAPLGRDAKALRAALEEAAGYAGAVIVVDEAGTAGNLDFAALVAYCDRHGIALRTVGDPYQQGSIDSGGLWHSAAQLEGISAELAEVRRFTDPEEGPVSLRVRKGDPEALDWYFGRGRIEVHPDRETAIAAAAAEVAAARDSGETALFLSGSSADRKDGAAAVDLLTADPNARSVTHGDVTISEGQLIRARENQREIRDSDGDPVLNGSTFRVEKISDDGGLHVRRGGSDATCFLPAEYAARAVEPESALTVKRAQGATVGKSAIVGAEGMNREQLYVALSRAKAGATLHVVAKDLSDAHDKLRAAIRRDSPQQSAVEVWTRHLDERKERDQALKRTPWNKRDAELRMKETAADIEQIKADARMVQAKADHLPEWEQAAAQLREQAAARRAELETAQEAIPQLTADIKEVKARQSLIKSDARTEARDDCAALRTADAAHRSANAMTGGRVREAKRFEKLRDQIGQKYPATGAPQVKPGDLSDLWEWENRAATEREKVQADGSAQWDSDPDKWIASTEQDIKTLREETVPQLQTDLIAAKTALAAKQEQINELPGKIEEAGKTIKRANNELDVRRVKDPAEDARYRSKQAARDAKAAAEARAAKLAAQRETLSRPLLPGPTQYPGKDQGHGIGR